MKDFHVKVIGDEPKADLAKERPEDCPLIAIKDDCEDAISRQAMLEYQEYLHGKMSNEENYELWKFIKALPSVASKTESYEDAVSRKTIEKLKRWRFSYDTDTTVPKSDLFVKLTDLRDLPPVAPARQKGKWVPHKAKYDKTASVYECSICHKNNGFENSKYCPNCGTEMESEE